VFHHGNQTEVLCKLLPPLPAVPTRNHPLSDRAKGAGGGGVLIIIAAIACTFAANNVCNFVDLTDGADSFSRGIWRGQLTSATSCASYKGSSIYIERKWNSARAMSVLAQILAGFAFLGSVATLKPGRASMSAVASVALKVCLFEGLTLLLLKSSACDLYIEGQMGPPATTCTLGQGAKLAIAATVLWGIAGIAMVCSAALVVVKAENQPQEEARDDKV
jgi:hypothetical protein